MSPGLASAQYTVPPVQEQQIPACDTGFNEILKTKAWMEAQREVEVAQTLIQKTDSVMDYTCFKSTALQNAGSAFFTQGLTGIVQKALADAPAGCLSMNAVFDALRCTDADKGRILPDFMNLEYGDNRYCNNAARNFAWQEARSIMYPYNFPVIEALGYDFTSDYPALKNSLNCSESAALLTGLTLSKGDQTFIDAVCVAPGCTFNGTACE